MGFSNQIQIVGQGTVSDYSSRATATATDSQNEHTYSYIICNLTATPAAGWTFAGWSWEYDFRRKVIDVATGETTYDNTAHYTKSTALNPLQSPLDVTTLPAGGYGWSHPAPYPIEGDDIRYWANTSPHSVWSTETVQTFYNLVITATFTRNPRTPTHLLVNSFNRSTPVRLVYDPKTNLLVADY